MINKIINKYLESVYKKEIENFINNPIKTQDSVLQKLLEGGLDTQIGSNYKFANIQNKDEFRQKVPVFRYEDLLPYIEQTILENKQYLLWKKPIKWFAMSSGTTNSRSKYIPVTEDALYHGHYRSGKHLLSIYTHNYPDSRFLTGKTLLLGGSKQMNSIGEGIFTGDISAILIKNLYFFAKKNKTPESIALLPDWEKKLEALSRYAISNDIRAFMGVPSWLLVLLKRIHAETGKTLSELWPNLEVFFHGGVSFAPFEAQFKHLIQKEKMTFWETYNASEGFFGAQFSNKSKEMLLLLDSGIYYEFAPSSEWDKPNPETLTLEEVETGKNYAIIISSNGGLWRYMIGDTIEFTSVNPFLFKITGRTKNFINAFGEELTIDNAEKALLIVCEKTGAEINDFTAGPVYFSLTDSGAHEWFIEFAQLPQSLDTFAEELDKALKSCNSDYEAKRSYNLSLKAPIIHSLPQDTFTTWMKHLGKLGGQNKIPRLCNNREYIDRLNEFLNNKSQC